MAEVQFLMSFALRQIVPFLKKVVNMSLQPDSSSVATTIEKSRVIFSGVPNPLMKHGNALYWRVYEVPRDKEYCALPRAIILEYKTR